MAWTDRKACVAALNAIWPTSTREEAAGQLVQLGETWENHWEDLATFFAYPAEIRQLIYTTNALEGDNRGWRKVIKTKSSLPTPEAAGKLL